MPNAISKIFAVILAALVMFYFVTYQQYKKQEDLAYIHTYQEVTKFVDSIRLKGYITPKEWEEFELGLHQGSNVLYDIELVHEQKKYQPVYTNATAIEPAKFTGKYEVQYDEYFKEQLFEVLYDESVPYNQRMYKLQKDDYFTVTVQNKTKFQSTMLLSMLTGGKAGTNDTTIYFPYGGMILNEDWND
ncbi:hypothetical protein [Solibacillus isronensis]|uniref:hypothetical protein n=1 Tax=Solibacillus isronensis TaxID=412383 RepID=UPI0009A7F98A|nr:hypothetical protein [Solibacillus isronensis]